MSERKPIWKRRTTFSKNRNVAVVVWPPGEYEGHPTPPSITLEEGKKEGETWNNSRISLTMDKLPNIVLDLQTAYQKALEIERERLEPEAEVAQRESAKPTDPVQFLKASIFNEIMASNTVYPRYKIVDLAKAKHDWANQVEIEQAFQQLLEEGKVRPKFDNLNLVGFLKVA